MNTRFTLNQKIYCVFRLRSSKKYLISGELNVDEIKVNNQGEVFYKDNRYPNHFGWMPEYVLFPTLEEAESEVINRNQEQLSKVLLKSADII